MLPVLYYSREFRHVPIRERRKAAWKARQRAMRHWQFWFAVLLMAAATVIGSLIARHWFGDEPDGTWGAAIGFVAGLVWFEHTLFRLGMPYYREILSHHDKNGGSHRV